MNEQEYYMPETYRIGHPAIDMQHELLFVLYHEIMHTLQSAEDCFSLEEIFSGLNNYIVSHFQYEEETMSSTQYPERIPHFEEHRLFKDKVNVFHERFMAATQKKEEDDIAHDMATFLTDWLKHHIAEIDKKLAEYLNAHI